MFVRLFIRVSRLQIAAATKIADFARAVTHLARASDLIFVLMTFTTAFRWPRRCRFAEEIQHHAPRADGGDGIDDVLAGVLWRAATHALEEHAGALGIDVAAAATPSPALDIARGR